jgi:hypothetical protein
MDIDEQEWLNDDIARRSSFERKLQSVTNRDSIVNRGG